MSKRARDMAFRHFNKGVSQIEKGLHEEALHNLRKAEEHVKETDSLPIKVAVFQTYADILFSHDRKEEAIERYLDAAKIIDKDPEHMPLEQRANMFSNMALALEGVNRIEEAIERYQLAKNNYMKLVENEPANTSYISNAVSTLNNMGALLAEIGDNKEAFITFEESLKLQESLMESGARKKEDQNKRTTILENLLNVPFDETIDISEEKYGKLLEAYHSEINERDTSSVMLPLVIHNYAKLLETKGEKHSAFSKLEEALGIVSKQLDEEPDNSNSRKITINILKDMNRLLVNEENEEKLLDKYELILSISRKILAAEPDNTSFQLNVAFSLDIIGNLLKGSGRLDEALLKIKESSDIVMQVLETEHDDDETLKAGLSITEDMLQIIELLDEETKLDIYTDFGERIKSLSRENLEFGLIRADVCNKTGEILAGNKKFTEALESFEQALSIYDTVKHATGDDSKLNDVLENKARSQFELGLYDEALLNYMKLIKAGISDSRYADRIDEILLAKEKKADNTGNLELLEKEYEMILEIRTELLGLVPDDNGKNAARIKEIQEKQADLMLASGRSKESLELFEQLQENEGTGRYLSKIMSVLEKIKIDAGKGSASEELQMLQFLLSSYNSLMEKFPDKISLLSSRASVIDNIAYILSEKGENEEAEYMCKYALDSYYEIAELDPEQSYPVERIAALHSRIAEIAFSMGDADEAKARYETSIRTYRSLIESDSAGITHRLDHAGVLDGMGSFFLNMGMYREAKNCYESALRSYAKIMEQEPDNLSYRSNVTITLENLGYVLELMGRKDDAQWMYENARNINKE